MRTTSCFTAPAALRGLTIVFALFLFFPHPAWSRCDVAPDSYTAVLRKAHALFADDTAGANTDYIPELAKMPSELFGLALVTADGQVFVAGDADHTFSIQSVSKPFTTALVIQEHGDPGIILEKIGVEPSGLPFNSTLALELHPARSVNPLVNAGAIATVSLIPAESDTERFLKIMRFHEALAGQKLSVIEEVYRSESATNQGNRAIAHLLKKYDRIYADPEESLKVYTTQNSGRPVVLMGDRGRGKSHIMAVMHHGVQSPEVVEAWLQKWGSTVGRDALKNLKLLRGYAPISEPVHNHEYLLLWDLLFDRHPRGQYYRGQFESLNQPFPPRTLLEKMFAEQPTCLILDEFQTWYTGLPEKDPRSGLLIRQYAFNFIQILSELATDRPEILMFVISVLNNQNDAFGQVHRQGPAIIDFRGPSARSDRQKLLLQGGVP